MKHLYAVVVLFIFGFQSVMSQGVGINNATPDASSVLDVKSTQKGVLFPRMSQTERDAIVSPAEGLLIYNTTTHCIDVWNGTKWIEFCSTTPPCSSPPAPIPGSNSPVCLGNTLNLTASNIAGATYIWSGPNGFYSTTQNPSKTNVIYADSGVYSVRVFLAGCYSDNNTVNVQVLYNPYSPLGDFAATRYDATSFAAGSKGYVVGGQDASMYGYDPATNAWTVKASYPVGFSDPDGFSVNGKGYVIEGGNTNRRMYEYDTAANTWTAKANYPGNSIQARSVQVVGGYAYVGLGHLNGGGKATDWWRYDPATNTWLARAAFPGGPLGYAASFVCNGKIYVGTGMTGAVFSSPTTMFYEYDPATNVWTAKANFPGTARGEGTGFGIGSYGYIGLGTNGTTPYSDIWRYSPASNTWTRVSCDYPVGGVSEVQAMTNNVGRVFLATGWNGSTNTVKCYEFKP